MMASSAFRESLNRLAEIHERDIAEAVGRAVAIAVQPLSAENRRLAAQLQNLQGSGTGCMQLWEPIPELPHLTAPCAFLQADPSASLSTNGHSLTPPRPHSPQFKPFSAMVDSNGSPSDTLAEPSIDDTLGITCVCTGSRPCGNDQANGEHTHSDALPNWRPGVPDTGIAAASFELQDWAGDLVQDGSSSVDGYSASAIDGMDTGAGVTMWLYRDSCPCSQEPLDSATSTHPGTSDEEGAKQDCSAHSARFTCGETCSCCRRIVTPPARSANVYATDAPVHSSRPQQRHLARGNIPSAAGKLSSPVSKSAGALPNAAAYAGRLR